MNGSRFSVENLESAMLAETCAQCGHEERKGQLSMSWLWMEDADILHRMRNGCRMDNHSKQKLYLGTLCERGIRERLRRVSERAGWAYIEGVVLEALGGKLTGHPDCSINNTVVEIKTVPSVAILDQMRQRGRVPRKVFVQTNSYMLWGGYSGGITIYEERETGQQWITEIHPKMQLWDELRAKAERILTCFQNQ